MSAKSINFNLRLNFSMILFMVLALHAFVISRKLLPKLSVGRNPRDSSPTTLNIKEIRTVGAKESRLRNSAFLAKSEFKAEKINKEKSLSMSDLSVPASLDLSRSKKMPRPGSRPDLLSQRPKALSAIKLRGSEMKSFAQSSNAQALTSDRRIKSLSNSDISVNLEVPEGVNPDELNKYELMFYGFQRRTAINYVNSFFKNLDKFQLANPHLEFPMTGSKQVLTGRITYDEKGNIKKINMVRWSNVEKIQDFFVDVLKEMDTLHNPPEALWKKSGEFSIFFSLQLNG
ncbi:MAG TPA: hypothetical protein VNJ01_15980 [Bacteriovoracaceae bacterium]|nr:hypothetical protein [Bacteriovoracaceae bacterium]